MKYTYVLGALAVVAVLGGYLYLQSGGTNIVSEAMVFTDAENKQFTVQYDTSKKEMLLSLSGVQYELKQTESASGVKYESEDGQVVFWETGGEAQVKINGEIVFEDAMTTERRVEVLKSNKQGDPSANKHDFSTLGGVNEPCDSLDDNCSGPGEDVQMAAPGDPIPGIGITTEQGATAETMAEEESEESDQTKATDYNSSRSNRTTNN